MPRTLPILDNLDDIRIASPCSADWDAMRALAGSELGDDAGARARFCGSCEKNVYDLSSMTRDAALALIERHEGQCCVRFYKRADGTVLTEDCPVGLRAALRKAHLKTLAGIASCAGAVAAVFSFLLGTANPISKRLGTFEEQHTAVAGGMMMPEPLEPPMMGAPPPPDHVEVKGEIAPLPPKAHPKTPHVKPRKLMGKPAPRMAPPAAVLGVPPAVDD
jgi:hypothetical protein